MRPSDFHQQDWIIVIETLAQWAGAPDDSISSRRERAYELIVAIAAEEGLPADELLRQSISTWSGLERLPCGLPAAIEQPSFDVRLNSDGNWVASSVTLEEHDGVTVSIQDREFL